MMNSTEALPIFDCLASPLRLAIYRQLLAAGPAGLVAGEISAALALAPSKASFHFKTLLQAGLISADSEGRHQRYRLRPGVMAELIAFLTADCCAGHPERCGLVALTPPGQASCQPQPGNPT